jgi:ABC-2 type transport system ATP-binding protein
VIGYLTPEEYFYFIGDLRGQNKADVDALLATHEEFSTAKSKKQNIYAICPKKPEKVGIIATLIRNPSYYSGRTVC